MATGHLSYNVAPNPNDGPGGNLPVGSILLWTQVDPPSGYLLCDGAVVNRIVYATLFSVIGTTFGVGDGTTTFALPDTRDRVVRGLGSTYTPLGVSGGAETIEITDANLPPHTHPITDPGHLHDVVLTRGYTAEQYAAVVNGTIQYIGLDFGGSGNRLSDDGAAQTAFTNIVGTDANTGTNDPINIANTFVVLNHIIKAF